MSTFDEHRLLTMYINQYNQTNTHIDSLLNMLDEIKANIINIIHPRRTIINRHSNNNRFNRYNNRHNNNNNNTNNNNNRHNSNNNNRYSNNINRHTNNNNNNRHTNNINRHNSNNRLIHQNSPIFYDYNNPINPTIYNDFFRRRDNVFTTQNNEGITTFFQNFLNTTEIVSPTNEQIQNGSRIIRYGDIVNPLSQSCPISLDEFQENHMVRQLLHCGHLFHQTQFDGWFQHNVRCPVCRYDIRNTTVTNEDNSNNTDTTPTAPTAPTSSPTSSPTTSNPTLNQIEQVTFDITNEQLTDIFNSFARNLFQSTLNSNTHNNNRTIDPSNNNL
jgi:hypothetical protein